MLLEIHTCFIEEKVFEEKFKLGVTHHHNTWDHSSPQQHLTFNIDFEITVKYEFLCFGLTNNVHLIEFSQV